MKKGSQLHPAIRETVLYGTGTLIAQVISALRGVLIASILGPATYGLWKSVQVAYDWLAYTHFGILHGMAREIPILRKAGDTRSESSVRRIGLKAAVVTSIAAGLLLILFTWKKGEVPWTVWIGIALLLLPTQLFRFVHMICLAEGRFGVLSLANLALAVSSLLFMWILTPTYGIYGVIGGLGLGYMLSLVLAGARGIFRVGIREAMESVPLKSLVTAGFSFMAVDGLFVFWQRLDRLALIPFYGAESEALGFYGLATMVAAFGIQIPQVFTRVLFRRTVPVFDPSNQTTGSDLRKHLKAPALLVASLSPLLLSLGTVSSWGMIAWLLPAYSQLTGSQTSGCEESIAILLWACAACSVGLS
ncbi:MAG: hypothetical protein KC940_17465, partial [Candidatus Omnitrophica bacterium]|nr:hypothetical protein [Candidatus Omnitrophota bacterium]